MVHGIVYPHELDSPPRAKGLDDEAAVLSSIPGASTPPQGSHANDAVHLAADADLEWDTYLWTHAVGYL